MSTVEYIELRAVVSEDNITYGVMPDASPSGVQEWFDTVDGAVETLRNAKPGHYSIMVRFERPEEQPVRHAGNLVIGD